MSTVQADPEAADPSLMFSGVGSSIDITSEARDLSQLTFTTEDHDDGDDEDLYSESIAPDDPTSVLLSLVGTVQTTLKQSQGNLTLCQDVVSSIAGIDVDLDQKCSTKAVLDLLQKNVNFANEGNFRAILTGVDILVKYAVNLLKPKKNPNWRSIKTSNNVFMSKVRPLQGHEAVLNALGYTGSTSSSFEFPQSCLDPDLDKIAVVTSDLLVLQKELSQFCGQIHVNRDRFLRHFSTLPKSELLTLASPLGNTEIPLQRVAETQPLSPDDKPKEPARDGSNRPVPAPRRRLPPVSKKSPIVEQPPQPVAQLPQQNQSVDDGIPSVDTLPVKKWSSEDLIAFSGEVVPSVGPIKYPPSLQPSLQSSLQEKQPPKAAPRSARSSPSTEPSPQLRRPADFVSTPAPVVTQGVPTQVQAGPGHELPQAQYPPTSAMPPKFTPQGLQQLANTSAYSSTPGMAVASQAGPGHMHPQVQYPPNSTMPQTCTAQGLQHPVNAIPLTRGPGIAAAFQAGPAHVPHQGHHMQSPHIPTQILLTPTPVAPRHVHGVSPVPTDALRVRQSAPLTRIPSAGAPPLPPKPGDPHMGSSVDPPAIHQMPYPEQQRSHGPQHTGPTLPRPTGVPCHPSQPMSEQALKNSKPFKPPPGGLATPLAGVNPADISRQNLRQTGTQSADKPSPADTGSRPKQIEDQPLPGVTLENCAMCEGKPGIVHCDKCQSARCEACDKRWHSHPKRKTHETRLLVERKEVQQPEVMKDSPVKVKPPAEVIHGCYSCNKDETGVEYKCLTCNEYFCGECDRKFHSRADRRGHERVTVGRGRGPQAASSVNETTHLQTPEMATHPVGGARPKQPVTQGTNQTPPPQKLPAQNRQLQKPAMSKEEQLQAKIDNLLAEDLAVLEKLADVKSKYDDARSVDIEGQLMKEEKLLRFRHQKISDEMEYLKAVLEDLARGDRQQIQERPDERRPPVPAAQRVGYNQHPTSNNNRSQPSANRPPPLPPRNKAAVQKWKCEHCTFLNEDMNNNICVVCSKTTGNPQIIVDEQEHPIMITEEAPLRAAVQAHQGRPLQVEEEGRIYQYETEEEKAARLRKQEQEETAKQMEEERQKQQQNMSYRLLIMFEEARPHGYSLEDVKTAWDIVDREKSAVTPLDWLSRHLEHQLQLIKKDVILEFCRRFKLQVPEQSDQYIGTDEVHREWQQNDGIREKTANACVERIVKKVDDFIETTDEIADHAKAAKLLLDNSFDGELVKWELQIQAAADTAAEVDNWLGQMWDVAHATEHTIAEIFQSQLSEEEKREKVRRILMAERGMLWAAVDCVFVLHNEGNDWPDSIEAVEACNGNIHRARDFFVDCALCYVSSIRSKLIGLPSCQCHLCTECFTGHFRVLAQNTPCMLRYICPYCDKPDLEMLSEREFQDYFGLLGTMLRQFLTKPDYDLYQSKLVNWGLMKEENFRWCVGCSNGFVLEGLPIKRVQCPLCNKYQCFDCKQPWQDQHQGVTCEQFEAWKRDNDPELQAQGLAAHLKLNGINCPKCKMRYELAKGGCMHFRCPTCRHEFCCGCNLPFMKYPACKKYRTCEGKGLHAHHPRDCLYHLRDEDVASLQQLLQNNNVDYSRPDAAANAPNAETCPVNVQLETQQGLQDNLCGKALEGQSGLCTLHYKEYLVTLINNNNLDPVDILTGNDLEAVLRRNDKQVPQKQGNEADEAYRKRLVGIVKEELPLVRAAGGAAAGPPAAGDQAAGGQAAIRPEVGGLGIPLYEVRPVLLEDVEEIP